MQGDVLVHVRALEGADLAMLKIAMLHLQYSETSRTGSGNTDVGTGASDWDDPFDYTGPIDTAGARAVGAVPWTTFGANLVSANASGGRLRVESVSSGSNYAPCGALMPLPSGDWTFETSVQMDVGSNYEFAGLHLLETATGKTLSPVYFHDVGSGVFATVDRSNGPTDYGTTAVTLEEGLLEVKRVGTKLSARFNQGAGWVDLFTNIDQTVDFTVAPNRVGIVLNNKVAGTNNVAYFDYFLRTDV
jgi:hypothetical protein